MVFGLDWVAFRDWGSFVLAAMTLAFVAYDLWWVRRPRLRVRMRRFHDSERLDVTVLNRGGGPLTILNVYFEATPDGVHYLKMQWAPDDGTLPVTVNGLSAVDWHPELEGPHTMVLEGLPFGERYFWVPPPGWHGRKQRLGRREVFGGVTRELRGQREVPTPEQPVQQR
jgi:hypothetical protein